MEALKKQLEQLVSLLADEEEFNHQLDSLMSVYPFNEYEFIIAKLLCEHIITHDDYIELRESYIDRNLFLYVFEISAPRDFGEAWAQGHLKGLVPELEKPTKKLDPSYSGQYDFRLGNIRIEVKASRAVDSKSHEPLYVKALSSTSEAHFDMNFQQIKPTCCDVFIWVAVWRDRIRYWVLSKRDVENNRYFSIGQHRGNQGEGQLHVTDENIEEFVQFECGSNQLQLAIVRAYNRL